MNLNFAPSTIWTGDNLDILRGMNSDTVDLIYLDPPFNSNANYAAPVGSKAAGAAFKDTWTLDEIDEEWQALIRFHHPALYALLDAVEAIHGASMKSYITYMAPRLMEMKRVLKAAGSIYLHCDPTAGHYLKLMMDAIFGRTAYRNEIVWCYTGSNSPTVGRFQSKTDTLYFYAGKGATFNHQYTPYGPEALGQYSRTDEDGRRYRLHSKRRDGSERRLYLDEAKGVPVRNWWADIKSFGTATQSKERTGYPTQKPLALLRRIIAASSNEGDVVLDPFCGCANALIAAQALHRKWIGIDISPKAVDLLESRMHDELGLFFDGKATTTIPRRTDGEKPRRYNCIENQEWLFHQQEGVCNGCERGDLGLDLLEVDHVIPRKKGGSDHLSNLQLLCSYCNRVKGSGSQAALKAALRKRGKIAA